MYASGSGSRASMHEGDSCPLGFGPQEEQHVLDDVPKAGRPEFGRMRPRVGQELLNEFVQAFHFRRRDAGEFRLGCPVIDLAHDDVQRAFDAGERISNFVCEPGCDLSESGKTICASQLFVGVPEFPVRGLQ